MRKILFWGDEGSGKSTIAALLARYAVASGCSVLLVDAGGEDSMHRLLGLPRPKMTLVEDMGGADYVKRIYPCNKGEHLVPDLSVDHLPGSCMSRRDNMAMVSLGVQAMDRVGASALGLLFREFLGRLNDAGWWVFIDGGAWLQETAGDSLEVIDGVLEVGVPVERDPILVNQMRRGLLAEQGLPLFPVANRVNGEESLGRLNFMSEPLACFPEEDSPLSVSPEGRGLQFPRDFMDPLRSLWENLMSSFGSPRSSRGGFGGGAACRG